MRIIPALLLLLLLLTNDCSAKKRVNKPGLSDEYEILGVEKDVSASFFLPVS